MMRIGLGAVVLCSIIASNATAQMGTQKCKEEVQKAVEFGHKRHFKKALSVLDALIKTEPSCSQAFFERGMVHMEQDKDSLAIPDLSRALDLEPNYPGARDWLSRALASAGQSQRAAEVLHEELTLNPNGPPGMGVSPESWSRCAEWFATAGDTVKALTVLEEYFAAYASRVTKYSSYSTAPLRSKARLLLARGESGPAISTMIQAIDSPHKVPADHEVLIEAQIRAGNKEEAARLLEHYVRVVHGGFETERAKQLKSLLQ